MAENNKSPTKYTPIKSVRYWVQLVTPLVYDDSLSLYELIGKCVAKVNEVIAVVNPLGEGIDTVIQEALDAYKVEWEKTLNEFQVNITNLVTENNIALNNRIDELTESTQKQIDDFVTEVNQNLANMNEDLSQRIAEVSNSVYDTDQANRTWTLAQIEKLKTEIAREFPPVIDPTDGKLESVQTALNHMWDAWRENALTAEEYDSLELTAEEYDNKELTATAYDRYGKILLMDTAVVYSRGVPLRKSAINMTELKAEVGL